jgi:hypothetical protein
MNRRPLILLLACACLTACDDEPSGESTTADSTGDTDNTPTVDEQEIIDMTLIYEQYEKINTDSLPSQHGIPDTVNVWVPSSAAETFRSLSDGTVFDEGTIIVKEHLDADGAFISATVMYKGPAGYAPDAGDWWFGLVNPDGSASPTGQPDLCIGCHTSAADTTDWVLALPAG